MFTREHFLDAVANECAIAKHLYSKLPEGGLEYRITPGQRSTEELLRYLSACGIGAMDYILGEPDGFRHRMEEANAASIDDFPAMMDRQLELITERMNGLSDEELTTREVPMPTGQMMTIGYGLVKTTLSWLTGYRMQLFLQVKAAGAEIGTANNWAGRDWKRPEPQPEPEAAAPASEEAVEDAA